MDAATHRDLIQEFSDATGIAVREQVPAERVTTACSGGPIRALVNIDNPQMIAQVRQFLTAAGVDLRIIGAGSNLLIADEGVNEWVVGLGRGLRFFEPCGQDRFRIGGAMPLTSLSRELAQAGYSGLEFAGGIPGTLGGAIRMNAGAHGGEMALCLEEVRWISKEGEIQYSSAKDLEFSYRRCSLPSEAIIFEAVVALAPGDKAGILARLDEHLDYRRRTQPLTLPSFGSVFKNVRNPETAEVHYAGALIEAAGLKGHSIGGARFSELHANWIVNEGKSATTADILALIDLARRTVLDRDGVMLEPEVVVW